MDAERDWMQRRWGNTDKVSKNRKKEKGKESTFNPCAMVSSDFSAVVAPIGNKHGKFDAKFGRAVLEICVRTELVTKPAAMLATLRIRTCHIFCRISMSIVNLYST